jgi:asparagine synthase (glutamine-hydrolysing)
MCGISVIVNQKNGPVAASHIKAMSDKVIHRGPDDEGYFLSHNFGFGHRRLSIVDTSSAGHQPMHRRKDCIVFNGMVYNYIELRDELIAAGYKFHSQTDTEVILIAYQHWGVEAFKKFNGMWAFVIYDHERQSLTLCRDHFGIKPLYYTIAGDLFLAGSEIKQFTALPEFSPVLDETVAINFLTHGWLNYSEHTYLQYDLRTHQTKISEWYNLLNSAKPVQASEDNARQQVRFLFQSSVHMRMRADVHVGSCLSGGIDSSSIVSLIHNNGIANEHFTTFTSCYNNKEYDEQQFSDLVTRQTGYRAVKVFPELQELITDRHLDVMLYHQDQPFGSASHYSEFSIFKAAGENNMKVILDGQGSDEYLCGYPEFFTAYICELLREGKLGTAMKTLRTKGSHGSGFSSVLKQFLKSAYGYSMLGFVKKNLGKPAYPWIKKEFHSQAKKSVRQFEGRDIHDLSIQQLRHSSIPYQLHSEDRNSMMFSIESRLPFLDHRLVEYVVGLPSSFKINKGYTKFIFRAALAELPPSIRWRTDKMGFVAPEKEWVLENHTMIRNELELAVNEMPFFSKELLTRFNRFVQGKLGYEPIYFRAMALNRFCRIFKMEVCKV